MELDFIGWLTPRWRELFKKMPDSLDGAKILDVGCGQGVLGFLIALNYPDDEYSLIGIDGYKPYIKILKKMRSNVFYNELHFAPIGLIPKIFSESFDYVFCLDVLEHNEREYSEYVLENLIHMTSKKLFVTVPNAEPLHNEKRRKKWVEWREGSDNKFKGHVSSWSEADFPDGSVTIFDNRKGLTRSMRVFDSIRRKLLCVDWDERHILAVISGQSDLGRV